MRRTLLLAISLGLALTDEGPHKPDVFWELRGTDAAGTVVFPSGATGENALIDAMGSSTNKTFVPWKKPE